MPAMTPCGVPDLLSRLPTANPSFWAMSFPMIPEKVSCLMVEDQERQIQMQITITLTNRRLAFHGVERQRTSMEPARTIQIQGVHSNTRRFGNAQQENDQILLDKDKECFNLQSPSQIEIEKTIFGML